MNTASIDESRASFGTRGGQNRRTRAKQADSTRSGSHRALKPRWLAREEPRQWFATLPALGIIAWMLVVTPVAADGNRDWTVLFTERSVPMIVLLGCTLLANAVLYFVLTRFAFRGLSGADLAFIARASSPRSRAEAQRLKQNGLDEVYVAIGAGALSLATLVLLLIGPGIRESPAATLGTLVGVIGAWILIILGFSVRYMREWATSGAVAFPDSLEPPTLSDFGFIAVQMSTAYGFGHAVLRRSSVRRAALTHNVLGYVFNTVIIALVISVALPAVF